METPRPALEPRPYRDEVTMIGIGIPQPVDLEWEDDEMATRVRPSAHDEEESSNGGGNKTLMFGDSVPVPGFSNSRPVPPAPPPPAPPPPLAPGSSPVVPPTPAVPNFFREALASTSGDLRQTTRMDQTTRMETYSGQRPPSSPGSSFDPRARVSATSLERVLPLGSNALATPLASSTPVAMPIRPRAAPEERPQSSRIMAMVAIAVAVLVTGSLFFALPRLGSDATPSSGKSPVSRTSDGPSPAETAEPAAAPEAEAEETSPATDTDTTASLVIESAPESARLLLVEIARPDSPRLLAGPFPLTLEVPRQGYKLVATRAGYYDFIEPIVFSDGQDEKSIRVELYKRPAKSTSSEPAPESPEPVAQAAEEATAPLEEAEPEILNPYASAAPPPETPAEEPAPPPADIPLQD